MFVIHHVPNEVNWGSQGQGQCHTVVFSSKVMVADIHTNEQTDRQTL